MECGDQCVMTVGITRTQLWSANKWDTMDVSAILLKVAILNLLFSSLYCTTNA